MSPAQVPTSKRVECFAGALYPSTPVAHNHLSSILKKKKKFLGLWPTPEGEEARGHCILTVECTSHPFLVRRGRKGRKEIAVLGKEPCLCSRTASRHKHKRLVSLCKVQKPLSPRLGSESHRPS